MWPYSSVYIDHNELIDKILDHLFENGYEDVSLLAGNYPSIDTRHSREIAFLSYMEKHSSQTSAGQILRYERGENMTASIESILRHYLAQPNSGHRAILAIDMQSLHTVLKLIHKLSIQIPYDFAICGYDSWDWSSLFSPSITYLEQPLFEMGCVASTVLLDLISEGNKLSKTLSIHGSLKIGESTARNTF